MWAKDPGPSDQRQNWIPDFYMYVKGKGISTRNSQFSGIDPSLVCVWHGREVTAATAAVLISAFGVFDHGRQDWRAKRDPSELGRMTHDENCRCEKIIFMTLSANIKSHSEVEGCGCNLIYFIFATDYYGGFKWPLQRFPKRFVQ